MTWIPNNWVSLSFIVLYLLVLVRHAWAGHRHVRLLSDYLVAGRRLGGWVVALSFYATFVSTNTFIAGAGKSWDVGLTWCAGGAVTIALCCVSWFVVAPRFVPLTRKYDSLTVADFLGYRYNSMALRRTAGVVVCFASIIYLVALYRGSAIALSSMLGMPYAWAVIIIFAVVTAYTLAGGFESVVLTDAMQGVLMVTGAVALAVAVIMKGGGLANVMASLHEQDPELVSWRGKMPLTTILGIQIAVGMKCLVEPRQLSRFYGLKDTRALKLAAVVAPLLIMITFICLLPLGALAHAFVPDAVITSSDEVVPYLLSQAAVFGPVVSSAFLLVLLSAAMSSIDSVLLVAASAIDHDVMASGKGGQGTVGRTRIWLVGVSFVSMIAVLTPFTDDIVTITAFSGSLYAACFFPALVMGLFWRQATARGAMASLLCGSVAVVGWFVAKQLRLTSTHEVYVGLGVSLIVYLVAGMISARQRLAT